MSHRVLEKHGDPELMRRERIKSYPMKRFGKPEEVAQETLFLACDESSFMNGVAVVVDGGCTAR